MTINELIKIIKGESILDSNVKVKCIKTDTRKVQKGDIFIALKGNNYDGHDYVEEAINKGCIACIVDRDIDNSKCIKVNDTYECLYDIGKYIRNKYNIPLIAITGSNGKTTTKELIVHILKNKYNVLYNKDSKNNIIGVSDTLFNLNNNYDLIVMELGSNHIGEISTLSNMCNPTTSIITNIGSSHLEYFKTKKNIFKEKLSIIDGMKDINLLINGDNKYLKKLNFYKCGINKNNNLIAYNIISNNNFITFNIKLDKEYKVVFNNPGKHFISDILLAIKVCLDYNMNINDILERISTFKLSLNRMNLVNINSNKIIIDCYNSSYESIKGGINYLKNIKNNKLLIIGDILELGKHSKKIHKKINIEIKKLKNYNVLTLGNYSKYIKGKHFNTKEDLINYLKDYKIINSYIYIKGSRALKLEDLVKCFFDK